MARGKKYDAATKEIALAELAVSNNIEDISKKLNIPVSTLHTWKKEAEKSSQEFVELRNKRKSEFINDAWDIISKSKRLIQRKLERAIESEVELDTLLNEILSLSYEDLSKEQRKELHRKISLLKIEDISKLTTVLGTMYDKQALANNEATSIVEGHITLEQLVKKVEGDEF